MHTFRRRPLPWFLAGVVWSGCTPEPAPLPPDPWDSSMTGAGAALFESCASCHLADASGRSDGTVPRLAGQVEEVLVAKLENLASGHVVLPVMTPFARALSAQERRTVAAWLAALPPTGETGQGSTDRVEEGEALYLGSCAGCHGVGGGGMPALTAPSLCGQHERYIFRRAQQIAVRARADADPAMASVVSSMPAEDLEAVADYLSRSRCVEVDSG